MTEHFDAHLWVVAGYPDDGATLEIAPMFERQDALNPHK
jgi:hypothetical protein